MTQLVALGESALIGSAVLMAVVCAVRVPVRRWIGPQLGYALWLLPTVRLIAPPVPAGLFDRLALAGPAATAMTVLFTGPSGALAASTKVEPGSNSAAVFVLWLAGAAVVFLFIAARHTILCRRLRAEATDMGQRGGVRVVTANVGGPLAFGVIRRVIAVPRDFLNDYNATERDLALAHEAGHHARGDLIANWVSLAMLAAHWWNPLAWIAINAFRDDQELATDAHVLAVREQSARAVYATVLTKAAGVGALPACNLTARSNLKGRLMMLKQPRPTRHRLAIGGAALALFGGTAIAATLTPAGTANAAAGTQAVTIVVKPDGAGGYALIVGRTAVPAGAALPGGATLPSDFSPGGGCNLTSKAKPNAMLIKGAGTTQTYAVMCAKAGPAPIRTTLVEGLASLTKMRASIATQPTTDVFPEAERAHALGAADRSIREVKVTLAAIG